MRTDPEIEYPPAQGVSFGVFGLGNKQYEHFAVVGKKVHKALAALGAVPAVRRGDGDDDDDIEEDFDTWKAELIAALDGSPLVTKVGLVPTLYKTEGTQPCIHTKSIDEVRRLDS